MLYSAFRRLSKSHVQLANSVWTTNTALGMKHDGSSTKIPCTGNETWQNYKHCALGMNYDWTTNTVHWEWSMTELQTLCTGNELWLNYKHCALGMNYDWTTNTVHWEWTMTELQTLCTGNEPPSVTTSTLTPTTKPHYTSHWPSRQVTQG